VSEDGGVTLVGELAASGVARGEPLAVVLAPAGVALVWRSGHRLVAEETPAAVVAAVEGLAPRWVCWSARDLAPLVAAGVRPALCWDLGAVGRLLFGMRRDDPAAVWAAACGLAEPPQRDGRDDRLLLGFDGDAVGGEYANAPVLAGGQLSPAWVAGRWAAEPGGALRWAELALDVQALQKEALSGLPDPRAAPLRPALPLLTAHAESAAALLAVELECDGLPLDGDVAAELLRGMVGDRPAGPAAEVAGRAARDGRVLRHFPGPPVDLRSPAQVRTLLARIGLDLPDTRLSRLEPHAATFPAVAALLRWRTAERVATTYGWGWLERHAGGRLRGSWRAADGAAGRMTASAGLHNLPAELLPAVRAEPGMLLVRADLGQVEPRVLAVISGDPALTAAAREADLYAPVAGALRCDRPAAKVAVLAAMYGAVSGTAGAALRGMNAAYPQAMSYLRDAERVGRSGGALRTYGGRLLHFPPPPDDTAAASAGRYARNAVVQGAAAELFKAWAATVRAGLAGTGGRIVLCLHDELLLHVPEPHADRAAQLLRDALNSTVGWWQPAAASASSPTSPPARTGPPPTEQ